MVLLGHHCKKNYIWNHLEPLIFLECRFSIGFGEAEIGGQSSGHGADWVCFSEDKLSLTGIREITNLPHSAAACVPALQMQGHQTWALNTAFTKTSRILTKNKPSVPKQHYNCSCVLFCNRVQKSQNLLFKM